MLYSTLGGQWTYGSRITYSFMPDQTSVGGTPSTLFQTLNAKFATATWQAPGVTGGEQASGTDDIFWGNLDTEGRARIQTGLSPISSSTPINDGQWVRITQTRLRRGSNFAQGQLGIGTQIWHTRCVPHR